MSVFVKEPGPVHGVKVPGPPPRQNSHKGKILTRLDLDVTIELQANECGCSRLKDQNVFPMCALKTKNVQQSKLLVASGYSYTSKS